MEKIGTHNSATGERGKGMISLLLSPFTKTQSKSIEDQWRYGCRYFDLRVRLINGKLLLCHGLWRCNMDLPTVLSIIDELATNESSGAYVMITYEGRLDNIDRGNFITKVIDTTYPYKSICLTEINIKKPKWDNIYRAYDTPKYTQGYKVLDGTSWHTYLPIPYLWNKIFSPKELNEKVFTFVDFL